jgi:hypothetical protein
MDVGVGGGVHANVQVSVNAVVNAVVSCDCGCARVDVHMYVRVGVLMVTVIVHTHV